MPPWIAEIVVTAAQAYVAAGLVFALLFVTRGVTCIDDRAADAGWGFRALIVPGSALLWPFLAMRWAAASRARHDSTSSLGA